MGSLRTHRMAWLKPKAGKAVAARRKLGSRAYPVIEPAPGRYVKVRAGEGAMASITKSRQAATAK